MEEKHPPTERTSSSAAWKQLIIARKDLNMSPGKLAAQVSHGSMAWLTNMIRHSACKLPDGVLYADGDGQVHMTQNEFYSSILFIPSSIYEGWIQGSFTKVVCEARNRTHLLKACAIANELGLKEGKDYFLIKDNCLTELEPEEVDENGVGRTLTVMGFRPLSADACAKISRKFQLYGAI